MEEDTNPIENKNQWKLTLYYTFAIDYMNKKLKNKFTFIQITTLMKHYTNEIIIQEQQYINLVKRTKALRPNIKSAIRKQVMSYLNNPHTIPNEELRDMIQKKKHKEIEIDRVITYLREYEKTQEQLQISYIRYYYNKPVVDKLVKIIDENINVKVNNIEDYQRVIAIYNNVIKRYLEDQRYIGEKRLPQDISLSRINKLQDLIKNGNVIKLKRILKIKTYDFSGIIEEARKRIIYMQYLRDTEIKKHESDKANYKRIVANKIENVCGKHLDKKKNPPPEMLPSEEETWEFWNSILGTPSEVDRNHPRLDRIRENDKINMMPVIITEDDVTEAIRNIPNWKAPGTDSIQGYYIKYAKKYYKDLKKIFQDWLDNPQHMPVEYQHGRTTLVYKGGQTNRPENYRPITCVNVLSKVYTSILKSKVMTQLRINPPEKQISPSQLGNKTMSLGAKEGIIANKVIIEMQNESKMQFIETYYDVRKAFDSINHNLLIETLEYYQVPFKIVKSVEHMMTNWQLIPHYNKESTIEPIKLRRGVMQGDSLSPLLFILYINVISQSLNEEIEKIEITDTEGDEPFTAHVNHFFYVDDLKIIVNDPSEAVKAHQLVKETMKAIALEVNIGKCGLAAHNDIDIPEELREMPRNNNADPYRYLGIPMGEKIVTKAAIEELKEKIKNRMETINDTESSSVNYFNRIKSTVIGLLRYSFATIDWPITQLEEIDKLIRKYMTLAGVYGRGMSLPRLYVSRKELGHGLPCVRDEYAYELLRTITHYAWTNDKATATIIKEDSKRSNSMGKRMMKALRKKITIEQIKAIEQKYKDADGDVKKRLTTFIHEVQKKVEEYYIKQWKDQKVAGELRRQFEQDHVDRKLTGEVWNKFNIKRTAYKWVVRMQEGSTLNGNKKTLITGDPSAKFCKLCRGQIASNNHILLGCILNRKKHIKKHDYLASAAYEIIESKKGFEHLIPIEHHRQKGDAHLFWNTNVVSATAGDYPKRPDICFKDKESVLIADAAIVADHNLHKTFAHKIRKYEELVEFFGTSIKIKEKIIIPIVVSINGLIHRDTVNLIKNKLRRQIDWRTVIRNIVVRNMKDIMFYNGVNVSLEEEGEEEEQTESEEEDVTRIDDEKVMHLLFD